MRAILVAKALIDGGAVMSFALARHWPMAIMFLGFAVADAGALWLA